jgi:hypothetical protein
MASAGSARSSRRLVRLLFEWVLVMGRSFRFLVGVVGGGERRFTLAA